MLWEKHHSSISLFTKSMKKAQHREGTITESRVSTVSVFFNNKEMNEIMPLDFLGSIHLSSDVRSQTYFIQSQCSGTWIMLSSPRWIYMQWAHTIRENSHSTSWNRHWRHSWCLIYVILMCLSRLYVSVILLWLRSSHTIYCTLYGGREWQGHPWWLACPWYSHLCIATLTVINCTDCLQ